MYLADRTNLESMHQAKVLMFDGTFDYTPKEFYKVDHTSTRKFSRPADKRIRCTVYSRICQRNKRTVYAVSIHNSPAFMFLGIAFLPHKKKETYVELFTQVRQAMIAEFGEIGGEKTVMMDMELEAHAALEQVFPEWNIRSCYFHFVKYLNKQATKKRIPNDLLENTQYKKWFNEVIGRF